MIMSVLDEILRQLVIILSEIYTKMSLVIKILENAMSSGTVQSTDELLSCTYDDMMSFCQASRASTKRENTNTTVSLNHSAKWI